MTFYWDVVEDHLYSSYMIKSFLYCFSCSDDKGEVMEERNLMYFHCSITKAVANCYSFMISGIYYPLHKIDVCEQFLTSNKYGFLS